MPIGNTDPGSLIQANALSLNQGNRTAQGLISLGNQITESISINNERKEAQAVAPLLSQAYSQGLEAISKGDIAGGLQHIYQTNAQYAANPLLAPMGKQVAQSAGQVANDFMRQQTAEAGAAARANIAEQGWTQRAGMQLIAEDRKDQRQQTAIQASQDKKEELTPNQKVNAIDNYYKGATELNERMELAETPEEWVAAADELMTKYNAAIEGGAQLPDPTLSPWEDAETKQKITSLKAAIQKQKAAIESGDPKEGIWFFDKDRKKIQEDSQKALDNVYKVAKESLKPTVKKSSRRTSVPTGDEEDVIPFAPGSEPDVVPGTAQSGAQSGYIIGRRYAGLTYLGGDPSDPSNWEK